MFVVLFVFHPVIRLPSARQATGGEMVLSPLTEILSVTSRMQACSLPAAERVQLAGNKWAAGSLPSPSNQESVSEQNSGSFLHAASLRLEAPCVLCEQNAVRGLAVQRWMARQWNGAASARRRKAHKSLWSATPPRREGSNLAAVTRSNGQSASLYS